MSLECIIREWLAKFEFFRKELAAKARLSLKRERSQTKYDRQSPGVRDM